MDKATRERIKAEAEAAKQQRIAGQLLQQPASLDTLNDRLQSNDLVPHHPKPDKVKEPPKEKPARLKHRCGHERVIKDLESQDCPNCREANRLKKIKERAAKKAAGQGPPPAPVNARLPHQSMFNVVYDAAKEQWAGSLLVGSTVLPQKFSDSASGVFRLLKNLDRQYRQTLEPARDGEPKQEEQPTPQEPVAKEAVNG